MATPLEERLIELFPGLATTQFEITSPVDKKYNCIAWAAEDNQRWWEPDPMGQYYWPPSVPRSYTLEAYRDAFISLGYLQCSDENHVSGMSKVALYVNLGLPSHAARELSLNTWASKLGGHVDICHQLSGLEGAKYGIPTLFLHRETTSQ